MSTSEKVLGRDLANKIGVPPTTIANSARRLGLGAREPVQVVRTECLLVLTDAEAQAVVKDILARARDRKSVEDALIAQIERSLR